MSIFRRVREIAETNRLETPVEFWKRQYIEKGETVAAYSRRVNELAAKLDDAKKQIAFLERVIDRQRGPARVANAGVPKKRQGPLNMRLVLVSREEAALLVPGVRYDSVGVVGSFAWGADSIGVKVQDDDFTEKQRAEFLKGSW